MVGPDVLEDGLEARGGGDDVTGDENATPLFGDSAAALSETAAVEAATEGLEMASSSFLAGVSGTPPITLPLLPTAAGL